MDITTIRRRVKTGEYDLSEHAHRERQEEQITIQDIERTLLKGDILEKYPQDPRGESCLVAGIVKNKPIHAICGFRGEKLLIVTVYIPKPPTWIGYRTRAKEVKSRV